MNAQNIIGRFGMLFLHSLDLTLETIIPEIQEEDDADVKRHLSYKHVRKTTKTIQARPMPEPDDEKLYPFGSAPTWHMLSSIIASNPASIMDEPVFRPLLDFPSSAGQQFTLFTVQMFYLLKDVWVHTLPLPNSLDEAIRIWSLDGISTVLVQIDFRASNAGLRGAAPGEKQPTFAGRMRLFDGTSSKLTSSSRYGASSATPTALPAGPTSRGTYGWWAS